jgi:O-antigen/teichoic acid export membrane protein
VSLSTKSLAVLQRELLLFITSMLTSVVIARTLGPHYLGLWVILALIPSYAEALGRTKVDAAAVYFLGRDRYKLGDVVWTLNLIALATSGVIVLAILIGYDSLIGLLFAESAQEVSLLGYAMLAQIPANFLYMNYSYLHIHREDVHSLNAMVLTRALGSGILVLGGLLLLHMGLAAVVIGSSAGLLLALGVGMWRFGKTRRSGPWLNRPLIRDLFGYGGPLYLGTLLSHLNTYWSQAIVVAFCQPAQVAFFTLAQQLGQLLNKVTDALGTFLFPRLSKQQDSNTAVQLAALSFRVSVVILVPAAVTAMLLIRPAVLLLYGLSYEPLLEPFYIILPGIVMAASAMSLSVYFQSIGRADLVAKVASVPLLLQVIFGFWLIPRFELLGAAIALLVALSATAVSQVYVFIRVSKASLRRDLLVRGEDIRVVTGFMLATVRHRLGFLRR